MIRLACGILLTGLLLLDGAHGEIGSARLIDLKGDVVTIHTPEGIRLGIWVTKVRYPAPTLLVFSGTTEQSLGNPYFGNVATRLLSRGSCAYPSTCPVMERISAPANLRA